MQSLGLKPVLISFLESSIFRVSQYDYIKADDVTVTIASRTIPQQLFDRLKESGIAVEN